MSDFVYTSIDKKHQTNLYKQIAAYAESNQTQIYCLKSPLIDCRYKYESDNVWVLLMPKYPITFVNSGASKEEFDNFVLDFKEDLSHIVDKYHYSDKLGRPRTWNKYFAELGVTDNAFNNYVEAKKFSDERDWRVIDTFTSLLIGCITEADKISLDVPLNLLDRIKNNILLFDTNQTKFLYQDLSPEERIIRIQGLAGTGKTELLLHKLKDIYLNEPDSKICFTCHNKVLADVLKKRIPAFFDVMMVNKQIEWDKRLFCYNAWGNYGAGNGVLSYVSEFYDIPFYNFREASGSFDIACQRALNSLKKLCNKTDELEKCFTYTFIDESQDFPQSFIDLCDLVTEKRIYLAGDIFQNIFTIAKNDQKICHNVLLNKCYRTDPRTFMFAHAMGLGLFGNKDINWLTDEEWTKCGYEYSKLESGSVYQFSRQPVKRFEKITDEVEDYKSLRIFKVPSYLKSIIQVITEIKELYPNVKPDDIALIFIDGDQSVYEETQKIGSYIERHFGWKYNLAYLTKEKVPDTIFISNRNNVKGLEFPFVFCLTRQLKNDVIYRHSLYTMLSRSHLQSILILGDRNEGLTKAIVEAATEIITKSTMTVKVPDNDHRRIGGVDLTTTGLIRSLEERIDIIAQEIGIPGNKLDQIQSLIADSKLANANDDELRNKIRGIWDILQMQ